MSNYKIEPISSTNIPLSNLIHVNKNLELNYNLDLKSDNILLNQFNWLDNKLENIINVEKYSNSNPPEPTIPVSSASPLKMPTSSKKLKKKLIYFLTFSIIGVSSLILCLIFFL